MGTINITGTGGIIEGNLGTADVDVNLDAALELDGSADYLKNSTADFRTTDTAGFITAWVRSDDWNRGTQQHWFSATDEATGNYYIRTFFNSDGKLYIKCMDSSVVYDLKSTNAITDDGNWHHIAVGSTGTAIKMYIDGIEETVVVASGSNNGDWFGDMTDSKLDHVVVGALHDNAGVRSMFDGYIADVRYYSDTLTDAEVLKLSSKINATTSDIDNLQHWWKLNSTTIDSSNLGEDFGDATDLDLTPTSIVASNIHTDEYYVDVYDNSTTTDGTFTVTQGKVEGLSLSYPDFDGDADYIEVADAASLDGMDALTISAWVKATDSGDSTQRIIDKKYDSAYSLAINRGSNDYYYIYVNDNALVATTGSVTYGSWQHVVFTYDSTGSGTGRIYVDGVLNVEDTTFSGSAIGSNSHNLIIGDNYTKGGDQRWDGGLRDIKMFKQALSADQVASLYSGSFNVTPDHWWKIDEGTGATAAIGDYGTGTDADGTGVSLAWVNGTLDLDGTLTIEAEGTLSAPRGNLDLAANIDNAGAFTHNNGTVRGLDSIYVNQSSSVAFTFYNWQQAGGQLRFYKDETIERQLQLDAGASHCYIWANKTLTMGTATNPESSYPKLINNMNTGDKQFWFYAGDGQTATLAGVLETHPIIVTNTNSSNFQWGYHNNSNAQLKNCDFQFDITLEGSNDRVKLTGDCEFDAFTVGSGDILDLNGQRMECSGHFDNDGTTNYGGAGAMLIASQFSIGGVSDEEAGANLIITGQGSANTDQSFGDGDFVGDATSNIFVNNGSTQLDWTESGYWAGNIIVGSSFRSQHNTANKCNNLTIATGGELYATDDEITVAGDFTTSGGLIGKSAVTLDGTGDWITIPDHSSLDISTNLTLEGWIKLSAVGDYQRIISKGRYSDGYLLGISNGERIDLTVASADGSPAYTMLEGNTVLTVDNKWHHIAGVVDADNDLMSVYLDGKLDGQVAWTETIETNNTQMAIGSEGHDGSAPFFGTIGRVSVWAEALSVGQIRNMMFKDWTAMAADNYHVSSNPNGFTDGNAKLWYEFNEGTDNAAPSGTDVEDLSAESNNGTFAGDPAWAGAGTFDYDESTLKMTGTNKYIYHKDSLNLYKFEIETGGDSNLITLKDINGGNSTTLIYHTIEQKSGRLVSNTNEMIQIGRTFGNVLVASGKGAIAFNDIYRWYIYQNSSSGTMNFPSSSSTDKNLTIKSLFLTSNSDIQAISQGNITFTDELRIESSGGTNTFDSNGNNITAKLIDVKAGGALQLDAGTTLTFTDVAGCGFGSSVGTLTSSGTSGDPNTITSSAGGTPSNYWDANTSMNITADYTTFDKFESIRNTSTGDTWDIDNCTFTNWKTNFWPVWHKASNTLSSFTNNTFSSPPGSNAYGPKFSTAHSSFDNIVISGSYDQAEITADSCKLEFQNSNFDITSVSVNASGHIVSKTHDDTTNLYEICAGSGALTYSTVTNEFDSDADVKLRTGILTMNEDNKVCDTFNVFSGATIRVSDAMDLYVQGVFDNDGTWVQTAGYGGDIHVGDFTPFDSGDILDNTEFVDTGFHDTTHYLEMDL